MSKPSARQRLKFIEQYRSYVINYNLGKDETRGQSGPASVALRVLLARQEALPVVRLRERIRDMSICFVAMPFGKKKDASGREIDFNSIYEDVIAPAIRDAQLTPYRADEELRGGIIHQPMYEALLLCDFVVADLTTANPNVFYELGIRHAMKPYATVLMQGGGV